MLPDVEEVTRGAVCVNAGQDLRLRESRTILSGTMSRLQDASACWHVAGFFFGAPVVWLPSACGGNLRTPGEVTRRVIFLHIWRYLFFHIHGSPLLGATLGTCPAQSEKVRSFSE